MLGNLHERTRIGLQRFGNCLVMNELSFAAAVDQAGFAQNFQVVRNSCGGDSTNGNDFSAGYALPGGDGPKNFEPGPVGQGFGYFFDLRAIHEYSLSVADLRCYSPQGLDSSPGKPWK